jgi:hypothetical protein
MDVVGKFKSYPGTGACQPCPKGQVSTSTGASTCESCASGFVPSADAASCVSCNAGTYASSSTMVGNVRSSPSLHAPARHAYAYVCWRASIFRSPIAHAHTHGTCAPIRYAKYSQALIVHLICSVCTRRNASHAVPASIKEHPHKPRACSAGRVNGTMATDP